MGRYDNYNNEKRINKLEKRISKVERKRRLDLFELDRLKAELEKERLFESCQIFGREDFWKCLDDPNDDIMFNDDKKLMYFFGDVVGYADILGCELAEKTVEKLKTITTTQTRSRGGLSRALFGGMVAGEVGAIIGAMTAGEEGTVESTTENVTQSLGKYLYIYLKDDKCLWVKSGKNKHWRNLVLKISLIAQENNKKVKM